ncbi:MAG: ABC transporter ATP-binding protein [Oscillospiraceae bacterium]|jgi:ABC-2 type transport system ATP-binding protein|nr:ABC transporter ATP-binding protein [Oscillospiraceae bacterium]
MGEDYILRTVMLTKLYNRVTAVDGVSINIRRGDIYGLIGRNGAGKTTLIRMILGVAKPTKGKVELFGGKDLGAARKKIGSIIERPSLYPTMTVEQNLEVHRILLGIENEKIVGELLEKVALDRARRKKASDLSLGMKQRLALAMTLIASPEFLVLDEPTNGLDPSGIKEVRDLVKDLNQNSNVTIFISSHLLGELSKIASRYGIVEKGKLIEEFSSAELDERAKQSLLVKVDNIKRATEIIEKDLGTKNYKVRDDNIIELFENGEKPGEVNRILSNNGIVVESICKSQVDLEAYFLKITGTKRDI